MHNLNTYYRNIVVYIYVYLYIRGLILIEPIVKISNESNIHNTRSTYSQMKTSLQTHSMQLLGLSVLCASSVCKHTHAFTMNYATYIHVSKEILRKASNRNINSNDRKGHIHMYIRNRCLYIRTYNK